MNIRHSATRHLTLGALIAAAYVALTVVFAPISFGPIQVRIAEALTILPMFTPAAVPGLFIGCVIGNLFGDAIIWDVIFGSFATLIGAAGGWLLRRSRWLVPVPAIVANAVIVPPVLRYGYGISMPLPLMTAYITVGESLSCYVMGELLASVLLKNRFFRNMTPSNE
ncbi:MAG: QueT transporter family protein [Pyramidobacter sp.]|nr:QueT transporter family protein [Pyramidobacter sp.]